MVNQQATEAELGWLAGILDGEGWIGFSIAKDARSRNRRKVLVKTEIQINNTDPEIIEKTAAIFEKIGVTPYRRTTTFGAPKKIVYSAATKNMTGVQRILIDTKKYLTGNKRKRAHILLRFIESRSGDSGRMTIPDHLYSGAGPRYLVRPYTDDEINMVRECRLLQCTGASETSRRDRDKQVDELETLNREYSMLDKI